MKPQTKLRILSISSSASPSMSIKNALQESFSESFEFISASDLTEAKKCFEQSRIDLILLDIVDANPQQLKLISTAKQLVGNIPILALSLIESEEIGIEAIKRGAYDCISMSRITPEAISRVIQYCLERHRRIALEQEMISAAKIQRSLLPEQSPEYEGVDVSYFMSPASHSCGDYLDHFVLPSGKIAMVVGDVSGHGLPAALKMIELRTMIRSLANEYDQLSTVVSEMNSFLLSNSASIGNGGSQFITLFIVAFDPNDQSFDYVGAGHSGMLIGVESDLQELKSTGVPLGLIETDYYQRTIQMRPGDLLFLGSDGLQEAAGKSGERFGNSRIQNVLREEVSSSANLVLSHLLNKFREFHDGQTQEDDISIMIAKATLDKNDHPPDLNRVFEAEKRTFFQSARWEITPCE